MEKYNADELNLKSLWTALSVAEKQQEKRGLEFGRACYEFKEKFSAQGQTSANLAEVGWQKRIESLDISLSTAKNWIARWEIEIGTRPPKPTEPEVVEPEPEEPKPGPGVTPEERDRKQLEYLVKRVSSLAKALKGLNESRWSKHPEYAAVVQATVTLKGVLDTL